MPPVMGTYGISVRSASLATARHKTFTPAQKAQARRGGDVYESGIGLYRGPRILYLTYFSRPESKEEAY